MPISLDDAENAAEKAAEFVEENWEAIEGAAMLIQMDLLIQKWCKKVDDLAEAAIDKLPHREAKQPDFSCEEDKAAVKVSLSLKAVHIGAVKLIHRTIPKEILKFLKSQFTEVFEKLGAKAAAKKFLGKLNFVLDSVISVAVGTVTVMDYMDDLENAIHKVLGCSIDDADEKPMRYDLNAWIETMKARNAGEARPMKNVHTRHPGGEKPKRPKAKKPKKGSKKQPTKEPASMHTRGKDY